MRRVEEPERSDVLRRVVGAFVKKPAATFWWEHLREPCSAWATEHAYRHLPRLAPNPDADCWLITGLDDAENRAVFHCTPATAAAVIAECPCFEYAVVDPGLTWMVIENHHDVLIAAGDAAARLDGLQR